MVIYLIWEVPKQINLGFMDIVSDVMVVIRVLRYYHLHLSLSVWVISDYWFERMPQVDYSHFDHGPIQHPLKTTLI